MVTPSSPSSPTVLLLSTSDTDLITARASGANFRWANPSRLLTTDVSGEIADLLVGVDVVVVRILGGYRSWQDGIDAVVASGVPTVVVSGEQAPDADLMERSNVPAGIALQAHIYLAQGGVENLANLHAFLSDTVLMTGVGFDPPAMIPTWGRLERPGTPTASEPLARWLPCCTTGPSNWPVTPPISRRCVRAIENAGGRPLPLYCASLRTAEPELMTQLGARRCHGRHRAGRRGSQTGNGIRRWR